MKTKTEVFWITHLTKPAAVPTRDAFGLIRDKYTRYFEVFTDLESAKKYVNKKAAEGYKLDEIVEETIVTKRRVVNLEG